jgi:hypothetical protein
VSWAFVRREWGAVTFVLTVVVGMIVVPLALYLTGVGPTPVSVTGPTTATSARETNARVATPAHTPSPSASPSK